MLLLGNVFRAPGWGLDGNRWEAVGGEVVGAGPHVDFAGLAGQKVGVGGEFGGDPGAEFVAPLIEVHDDVDAAELLHVGAVLAGRLAGVEWLGSRGEEPEGVEVGATDGLAFEEGGERFGVESEGQGVAGLRGTVEHRPFMKAKAGVEVAAALGCGEEFFNEAEPLPVGGGQARGIEHPAVGGAASRTSILARFWGGGRSGPWAQGKA